MQFRHWLVKFVDGPWNGEVRSFVDPPPGLFVKATGGRYVLHGLTTGAKVYYYEPPRLT